MIREENLNVHCQGCYFLGDAQVLGYGRLNKMAQEKDTLNKNQSLPIGVDVVVHCSFSIYFCASYSS